MVFLINAFPTCMAVHHTVGTYNKGRVKKKSGTSHLCANSVNILSISSSEEVLSNEVFGNATDIAI
jgi:hypothetical protein